VALPGACARASIALWVIGACKPPLHDKAIVLEEVINYHKSFILLKAYLHTELRIQI
jgi:hypothetical protein